MAERDTIRWRVNKALEPTRGPRTPKIPVDPKWFRKNAVTINVKLRQEIIDALPFEMDKQLADLILRTIFSKIVEGVKSDGRVVINGFGRFVKRKRHRVWRKFNPYVGAGKIIPGGRIAVKPTNTLAFEACKRFRRSMRDEEQDA